MFDANQDYAEARNPDRYRILGLELRPYCEGHRTNLRRVNSPFVCGGAVNGAALVLAVLICSRTWEAGELLIASKLKIRSKLLMIFVSAIEVVMPSFVPKRASALWDHIQEAGRLPRGILRRRTGSGEPAKADGSPAEMTYAPSPLVLYDICSHYHWSQSHVMNMPLRETIMLRHRLQEMDGFLRWRPTYYNSPPEKQEATSGS